ncbi:MAG: DivIVA domain-containing protein [Bacillota bacterium]
MMGLTPMDIHNKEFERSFRGYAVEEVNEFLDRIAKDLEQLIRENIELKEQIGQLNDKLKGYQKLEETMHNAIVVAQETAEDVKQNANREADLIRREADREAQRIVEDARYRSSKVLAEHEELFKQAQVFKMRFRSFIEAQLSALEMEDWIDPQRPHGDHR